MGSVDDGSPELRFGVRVRLEREKREWTQAQLASRMADEGVKLHASAIAKIESNTRAIRLSEAIAIAAAFEMPLDELAKPPASEWEEILTVFRVALRLHRQAEQAQEKGFEKIRALAGDFGDEAPVDRAHPKIKPELVHLLAELSKYDGQS